MNRYNVMAANGGLIGPATEAVRFAQMHLNGGELDGVRILSPEAVALMQEMQSSTTGDPLGYGVAWRVHDEAEHPYVEHDGGGVGLRAKMRLYPEEGLAIVLMSNASDWDRDRVADAAANAVFSIPPSGARQHLTWPECYRPAPGSIRCGNSISTPLLMHTSRTARRG